MSNNYTDWQKKFASSIKTAKKAVSVIKRGQRVYIGSGAGEPQALVKALAECAATLADNQIIHIRTLGVSPYTESKFSEKFRFSTFFIGDNVREAVAQCQADYTPIFLSEVPSLFRKGKAPIDVALIQVTPPDEFGFCSLGVSVDIGKAAAETAKFVIAEVNPYMPRTLGDSFIHVNQIDCFVENAVPILELKTDPPDEISQRIGHHIANLVENGSTLQIGIGTIPDSVLSELSNHKDLGVHTEMVSDGILDLIEKGVITGARKTLHIRKNIASFALGTKRLYDFIDDNPMFEFYSNDYTNDPFIIGQNIRMVAINAALEIDLTGQVCSDSLGNYFYSGIGGQVDFIRGAARSEGGKPIIALPSTAVINSKPFSRIVSELKPGAGVVTSRGDVHYVVTEYGAVDLHGKSIRERAMALIHIAHPDFREDLMRFARERHLVYSDQVVARSAKLPMLEMLEREYNLNEGGTVHFRPVDPTDEPLLQELFYNCSERTIYLRFFSLLKSLSHKKAQILVDVDYLNSLAMVGTVREKEKEREIIIAVGRYHLDPATNLAECAFLVHDAWQNKGIGHFLLKRLIEIARDRGIKGFTADVLMDNTRMMNIFHHCAPSPIEIQVEEGCYQLTFLLNAKKV